MLDSANTTFKKGNVVVKAAEPNDICIEKKIIKCKLQRNTAVKVIFIAQDINYEYFFLELIFEYILLPKRSCTLPPSKFWFISKRVRKLRESKVI